LKNQKKVFFYSLVEAALLMNKKEEKINDLSLKMLGKCMICPTGDSNCPNHFKIVVYGHNKKLTELKPVELIICILGSERKHCSSSE